MKETKHWMALGALLLALSPVAIAQGTTGKDARISLGSDFTLYDEGDLQRGERTRVRGVYARVNAKLSEDLTMDIRYSWERDEKETDHVLSLGFAVEF